MVRYLTLLFLFFTSYAWADKASVSGSQVGMGDTYSSSDPVTINVVEGSGTSSSPITIYYPAGIYDGVSSIPQDDHTLYRSSSNDAQIPIFREGSTTAEVLVYAPYLKLLITNEESVDKNLYVAVKKSDGTYEVIDVSITQESTPVDSPVYLEAGGSRVIFVRFNEMCESGRGECDEAVDTLNTGENLEFDQTLYVFASDNVYSEGDAIDPDSDADKDGVYLKVIVSSFIPQPGNFTISDLKKGDSQLKAYFKQADSADLGDSDGYQILAIASLSDIPAGALISNLYSPQNIFTTPFTDAGYLWVRGLANDQRYYVSLGVVNKFNFVTVLTAAKSEIPMAIETFLQSTTCYILSAGFQHQHYIIDYFRKFRSEILSRYSWGRIFISWYYKTAPKYAPYIYQSKILSALVRGLAYILYFFMHYFYWWITTLFLLGFFFWFKKSIHQKRLDQMGQVLKKR